MLEYQAGNVNEGGKPGVNVLGYSGDCHVLECGHTMTSLPIFQEKLEIQITVF